MKALVNRIVVRWALAVFGAALLATVMAAQASGVAVVTLDKASYGTGERVAITASGFAAGEQVAFRVVHADGSAEASVVHEPWTDVADLDGRIATGFLGRLPDEKGADFTLIATGATSGASAQASFHQVLGPPGVLAIDRIDYRPGDIVEITGSAFLPGERVVLDVVHLNGGAPGGSGHDPWSVVADATGAFRTSWYVSPDDSTGSAFRLTARGATSTRHARTTFSDGVMIAPTSQLTLWVDANKCNQQGPRAAWLSFLITNTGASPLSDVTVTFDGFTGTNAAYLSVTSDTTRHFTSIPAGASVPVYFYVDYSGVCGHGQGPRGDKYEDAVDAFFNLKVIVPGVITVTSSGPVNTDDLVTANAAGKATASSIDASTLYVGQQFTQSVTYEFGNNTNLFFQPAGDAGFDATCLRLVGSRITNVSGSVDPSLIGLKDRLWFETASVTGGGGNIYLAYTWQVLCSTDAQPAHPWAAALSGQKFKYEDYGVGTTFPAATDALTVAKSVSPSGLPDDTGGPITWTVTFTNPTDVPLHLSEITDILPAPCMSINEPSATGSDVTAANSSSMPVVGATGTVKWVGQDSPTTTYQVPASGTLVLKYKTNITGCEPGSYDNRATGTAGTTTVGPASARFILGGTASIGLAKSSNATGKEKAGDTITYSYVVTNTGGVELASVSVADPGLVVTCPATTLAVAAEMTCTATYVVTQANVDAAYIENTATATGTPPTGDPVSQSAYLYVPLERTPHMTLVKTATLNSDVTGLPGWTDPGDTITYAITVTNDGNQTLTNVKVTDPLVLTGSVGQIVPGGSSTFSVTYTLTQADIDAGHVNNTATATCDQLPAIEASANVQIPQRIAPTVAKSGELDMTKAGRTDQVDPGDEIHYELSISNDGNVTLTNVTLSDPLIGTLTCAPAQPATLLPSIYHVGTTKMNCTGTYVLQAADIVAGHVPNTATASFTQSGPMEVHVDVPLPALSVVKTPTPATYTTAGQVINYQFTVTNTGGPNATLSGPFAVSDDKMAVTCPTTSQLAVGASLTCTGTYTITQADLDAGSVTNTAVAFGSYWGKQVRSNPATATVTATQKRVLTLTKTASPQTYSAAGQVITYGYTIVNDGNVTLTGPFTLTDDKVTPTCPNVTAAPPGLGITCEATYTITQADLQAGSVTNHAKARAVGSGIDSNEASTTVTGVQTPALALAKTAVETTYSAVGQVIHYSYLVTNAGNITLQDPIVVSDTKVTVTCPALPVGGLVPGASVTCTSTYAIAQADLDAGAVINTAFASSGSVKSPSATLTVPATQTRVLTLGKAASPTTYGAAGQTITYTFTIVNGSNITLAGPLTITDNKLGSFQCGTATSLAPTASITCTKTYTVQSGDLLAGSITNTATATNGTVTSAPASATVKGTGTGCSTDTRPPTVTVTGMLSNPTRVIFTVKDNTGGSGIAKIETIVATNVKVTWPSFTAPYTGSIVVTGTKINQGAGSVVGLRVTDACGNVTVYDPADVTVNPGRREAVTIEDILGDENLVQIVNNGLQQMWISVNGRAFRIALRPNETRIIDIGWALRPGSDNTITIEARGKAGTDAMVLVYPGDAPARQHGGRWYAHRLWMHEIRDGR